MTSPLSSPSGTGSSSGGVFTSGMAMEDNDGNQLVNWSIVGTSSSDSITSHGNLGDVMTVALALTIAGTVWTRRIVQRVERGLV
jgi:hypothetical protein